MCKEVTGGRREEDGARRSKEALFPQADLLVKRMQARPCQRWGQRGARGPDNPASASTKGRATALADH